MEKKNIFIICYGCKNIDNLNPNAAAMISLAEYLKDYYNIQFITDNEEDKITKTVINNVVIHAFPVKNIHKRIVIDIESEQSRKYLENTVEVGSADVCISVTYPFYSSTKVMKIIGKINPRIKKVIYEFDPLAFNGTYRKNFFSFLIRFFIEAREFMKVDSIWLTRELYEDYRKGVYRIYSKKFVKLGIPLIRDECIGKHMNIDTKDNGDRAIQMVYAGTFYDKIRSPRYLMEVMKGVTKNIDAVLHVYGSILGNDSLSVLEEAQEIMGEKLVLHGKIDRTQIPKILLNSDILINVSNTVTNQLPSKVFEYIETQKPIVNFWSVDNDSSNYYLSRYPLALIIRECWDKKTIDENVESIVKFCRSSFGRTVGTNEIADLYKDCIARNIAQDAKTNLDNLIYNS